VLQLRKGRPGPPSAAPTVCANCEVMAKPCKPAATKITRPSLMPHRYAGGSGSVRRKKRNSATRTSTVFTTIMMPIVVKTAALNADDLTLKCEAVPRAACMKMHACSTANTTAMPHETTRTVRP
jgi:hypothetical protein